MVSTPRPPYWPKQETQHVDYAQLGARLLPQLQMLDKHYRLRCHVIPQCFSEQYTGVNSLKIMTTLDEFSQFASLPIELQLLVFQFAFHLSPARSHTPLLITPSTSLSKVFLLKHDDYPNRPISSEDCESTIWPRVAPIPRNWLIHDKNIYSSHGNDEWKIYLKSNSCVERECWSVKHIRIRAVENVSR